MPFNTQDAFAAAIERFEYKVWHAFFWASAICLCACCSRMQPPSTTPAPRSVPVRCQGSRFKPTLPTHHPCQGEYHGVFPVKCSHDKDLIRAVVKHGAPYGFGLEVRWPLLLLIYHLSSMLLHSGAELES